MIARSTRDTLLRHPWAVQALQGRGAAAQDGPFGPNGLRHFEQSLAAVATAPLDTAAKLDRGQGGPARQRQPPDGATRTMRRSRTVTPGEREPPI